MTKPKRARVPTLATVLGERPLCQTCHKGIKPHTWTVEVDDHLFFLPTVAALRVMKQSGPVYPTTEGAIEQGYQPDRVFRIAHLTNYRGDDYTKIHFWRGTYEGYGWHAKGEPPLFCSEPCATRFAVACWRAGMRIDPKPDA